MLLILIAVYLLSKDSAVAPPSYPLDARAATNSCDDINRCRTLFDVVWGCLATIFACTWVSMHPNVPPPNQSRLQLFWQKLKMMLVGIIAPEIMSFFCCMGGFVSSTGYLIATQKQLLEPTCGFELQETIRSLNEEEIMDKSKGDAFSKGVALLQGLWFTVQCLARVHQHLAITQLEIATLAFAIVNIFIWLLWWNKPLDVQWPIVLGPSTLSHSQAIIHVQFSRSDRFVGSIFGFDIDEYGLLSSTSMPSFWSLPLSESHQIGVFGITTFVGTVFGAIHCTAWNTIFPSAVEMWIWRSSSSAIAAIPGLISLGPLLAMVYNMSDPNSFYATKLGSVVATTSKIMTRVGIPIYVAARLILIILPLADLRSLPASALVDVNWSMCIPHI
ncbi:hypothetical protein MSAN_00635200 [Mycena sanguinolenta]|uniref:Uncharacterized protein n=1 Tax=Mycena sanguinolenta TaxID=230812 RepID=A0A8H6Z3A4_9AGAR|nr:hypothetical protein MSAN_00635200 [Mycena sanguinolenta]